MSESYKPVISMKEVPEHLRKLRRQYLRYQQAEIIYSISHKKLLELSAYFFAFFKIISILVIFQRFAQVQAFLLISKDMMMIVQTAL